MFERFGEMGSYEELNELARNFLKEGDIENLRLMAEENGIPEAYAEMFIAGEIPFLCDQITAANGKLDLESKELDVKEIMADWVEYIRGQCIDYPDMAAAVRAKGKSLKGCLAVLLKWSFANQIPIEKEILNEAGVTAGRVTMGIPGMGQAKKLIREYYLGGENK